MEEKLEKVKGILKKYNQENLLVCYEKLGTDKQEKLLDQILAIDFEQMKDLYANINKEPEEKNNKIEPIEGIIKEKLSKEEYRKYEEIGITQIKEGKLAVVTMAGGQGTRLGHNGPKGTFDLGLESHKSIFEILCDTLKRAQKEYDALPWYKKWFRDNPFYRITDEQKQNELCLSNCAMFFSYSMEEDKLFDVKKYFQGYYPNKSLDMDDYDLVRWWAEYDSI